MRDCGIEVWQFAVNGSHSTDSDTRLAEIFYEGGNHRHTKNRKRVVSEMKKFPWTIALLRAADSIELPADQAEEHRHVLHLLESLTEYAEAQEDHQFQLIVDDDYRARDDAAKAANHDEFARSFLTSTEYDDYVGATR